MARGYGGPPPSRHLSTVKVLSHFHIFDYSKIKWEIPVCLKAKLTQEIKRLKKTPPKKKKPLKNHKHKTELISEIRQLTTGGLHP